MKKTWFLFFLLLVLIPGLVFAKTEPSILRIGSKGEEVFLLQKILKEGYLPGPLDGVFGPKTREAVIAFQKVNNLKRDGIVGPQTWRALEKPQKPLPKYGGTHTEIDLGKQVLYFVEEGKIIAIIPISTGKKGTETPCGQFKVYRLWPGWHEVVNRPWGGWMYNSIYFRGAYAIHGFFSVPVYPASHGCVRVPLVYADWLYSKVGKRGEIIYIY